MTCTLWRHYIEGYVVRHSAHHHGQNSVNFTALGSRDHVRRLLFQPSLCHAPNGVRSAVRKHHKVPLCSDQSPIAKMTSKEDKKEALKVLGPPMPAEITASDRDNVQCKVPKKLCFTVVVLGASGDLAKKKTFPALFLLYSRGYGVGMELALLACALHRMPGDCLSQTASATV